MGRYLGIGIVTAVAALACAGHLCAFDFNWDTASGSWNVADNWSSQLDPDKFLPNGNFDDDAFIANGGTALLTEAAENPVRNLTISNGVLDIQSGGFLQTLAGLNVTGAGLLQLSGSAVLTVDASASNSARITGPDVSYNVGGGYNAAGTLIADITAATHSAINVAGTASLGGTLQVEISNLTPVAGQSWPLINAADVTGRFDTVDTSAAPALPRGQSYRVLVDEQAGDVSLAVANALILQVDRADGGVIMENAFGDAVDFHGYTIRSNSGILSDTNWSSFTSSGAAGAGWQEANPTANHLAELNLNDSMSLTVGSTLSLGAAVATGAVSSDEDLVFEYTTVSGDLITGGVEYIGLPNALELRVDPNTGDAMLRNPSAFISPDITGYTIVSPSDDLIPANWQSFQDNPGQAGAGWSTANPTSGHLAELNLDSSTLFSPSTSISLGQIFDTAGPQDLQLQYSTLSGNLLTGVVTFDELIDPIIDGDYNNNGEVEVGDLNLVLFNWDTEGSLVPAEWENQRPEAGMNVGITQLNGVLFNWGNTASLVASVPEPSTVGLFLIGLIFVANRRLFRERV